jgi:hypothetical protein
MLPIVAGREGLRPCWLAVAPGDRADDEGSLQRVMSVAGLTGEAPPTEPTQAWLF